MGRIRVIGRRQHEATCAYCRAEVLPEATARCSGCGVLVHPDCQQELGRCPTIGCAGEGVRVERPLRDRPWRAPVRPLPNRPPDRRLGARPSALARVGPYARLTLSAAFNAILGLGIVTGMVLALVHGGEVLEWMMQRESFKRFAVAGFLLAIGSFVLWSSLRWLWRVPDVFGQIGRLLDTDEPLRMKLTVTKTGSGKSTKHYADLRSPDRTGPQLHFLLDGILPPFWLMTEEHRDTHVWVYGVDGAPPYIIEFDDGYLALVHPGED